MTYIPQLAIFPHFCDSLNARFCLFFQPIQASFMCLTTVLRFVESVRTLPKPFKKRIWHLEYDFKNLKWWAQKIGEGGFKKIKEGFLYCDLPKKMKPSVAFLSFCFGTVQDDCLTK